MNFQGHLDHRGLIAPVALRDLLNMLHFITIIIIGSRIHDVLCKSKSFIDDQTWYALSQKSQALLFAFLQSITCLELFIFFYTFKFEEESQADQVEMAYADIEPVVEVSNVGLHDAGKRSARALATPAVKRLAMENDVSSEGSKVIYGYIT